MNYAARATMPRFRKRYMILTAVAIVAAGVLVPVVVRRVRPPEEPYFLVRILTWNVGRAYGLGGETRAGNEILDDVARTIQDADADAVVLQEIWSGGQLDVLLAALGGTYTGALSERERTDRAIAILVRGVGTFTPIPSKAGRPKIAATFDAAPRREVTVVGVHLSAFDPDRRHAEALEILEWVSTRPERLLLAGDFNLDPGDPAAGEKDRFTHELLKRDLLDLGAVAGSTALLGRRIDYVFGRPAEIVLARPRVVVGRRTGRMDHEPLLVHVGMREL